MKRPLAIAAVAAALAVAGAAWLLMSADPGAPARVATTTGTAGRAPRTRATASPAPHVPNAVLHPDGKYVGLSTPGPVASWTTATGTRPDLTEVFMGWGQPLPAVAENWAAGRLTLVSLASDTTTLPTIAAGRDDAYLRRIAGQARADRVPLGLDFDHEFNGDWYPWGAHGSQHATAAEFVAAWRHLHDVFTAEGADNVIWVWSPNVINPLPEISLALYWPGAPYVDWAGIVGYWTGDHGQGAYATLYGPTEHSIQALTNDPILITETGVQQGPDKPARTTGLIDGVAHDPHVIGFVYFDYGLAEGKRADWTLEDDPAALAAWRTAIRSLPVALAGSAG